MTRFAIEEGCLGEFVDPVNNDLEAGGDHPSHHFYTELAKHVCGKRLKSPAALVW